jgi:1-acyl-sn-glycerol-3-phosphate acyltransferase
VFPWPVIVIIAPFLPWNGHRANKEDDPAKMLVYGRGMERLLTGNEYRTYPGSVQAGGPKCPSLAFHIRMLRLYLRYGRIAAKGAYSGEMWASGSLEVLKLLEAVGVRFEMSGLDIPYSLPGPCVYIGNHMSTLETFVLPCLLQPARNTTFIVKESLTKVPFFGPVMRSRDPIAVGRSDPREDLRTVLEGGAQRLGAGTSVIVFPQTTRSSVFEPRQFNTIGIKLARRAGVPAVPVALKTDAWGKGKMIKDFGPIRPEKTVHICFGQPLEVTGSGREEHEKIVDFIQSKLDSWREQ